MLVLHLTHRFVRIMCILLYICLYMLVYALNFCLALCLLPSFVFQIRKLTHTSLTYNSGHYCVWNHSMHVNPRASNVLEQNHVWSWV